MLVAHLKAHLVSGETIELLPVRHELGADRARLQEEFWQGNRQL
jgi:hypothetical protein